MEDDPNKSTDDIASVHLQLEGLQIVTNNADFSHIMNLPIDVSYALLKQMDFMSYVNLALTCHKWFDIASTAPCSVKPILSIEVICWRNGTFKEDSCSDALNSKKCLRWTEDNNYKLVQRIESDLFHVNDGITSTLCEHLLQHHDIYKIFSNISLRFSTRILDFVYDNKFEHTLFSMFKNVFVFIAPHCGAETVLKPMFYNGKALPDVRCMCDVNANYCKQIVEDLYNGKFPKLQCFTFNFYMNHGQSNIWRTTLSNVGKLKKSYAPSWDCEVDHITCLDSRRFIFELGCEERNEWNLTLCDLLYPDC